MAFDLEQFRRDFDDACDVAEGIRQPVTVPAVARVQGGREVLDGRCRKCGTAATLAGEGKHLCRKCWTWLKFVKER